MEDSWPLTPVLAHDVMLDFSHLNPIWLSRVPQGSILVYFLSYIIVGKAFC